MTNGKGQVAFLASLPIFIPVEWVTDVKIKRYAEIAGEAIHAEQPFDPGRWKPPTGQARPGGVVAQISRKPSSKRTAQPLARPAQQVLRKEIGPRLWGDKPLG